jgi:hypothetical protein
MATAELVMDASPPCRRRRPLRYFFVGMAVLSVIILGFAFVPEYRRFAAGAFPIAAVLHVHAAIMAAWVAAFGLQAYLGATGRTNLHRRVGPYAVAVGWVAWTSMIFVEARVLVAHPIPQDVGDYDWMLPGPYVYLAFGILLAWAVHERRRPAWHKRLMTFALFLALQAAIQRFLWIPITYGYWPFALALDVALLVPTVSYDLSTLKGRLHPATIRGALLLIGAQALLLTLWGTDLWRGFASSVAHTVHG